MPKPARIDARPDPQFAVLPGTPFPLGATVVEGGTNFALFSEHAQHVYVCLFEEGDPGREIARHELLERTAHVFHGMLPGIGVGALYGFRVEGPFAPSEGHRFNVNKLLIDPYARALHGDLDFKGPIYGYPLGATEGDLGFSHEDDAWAKPKSVVLDDAFDWGDDRRLRIPWNDTLIYEAHVRGLTMRHPDVPENLRGTYEAITHPAIIWHLKQLGVTAIEFLPVQAKLVDGYLVERGLTNYWGYSTMGYFAPEQRYARAGALPGSQVAEFKAMVKNLHAAGIEVILDVVFNHTGEGNQNGPTLSFRGLDDLAFYHHSPEDTRFYMDFTGCGNSLNLGSTYVLKMVLDSLRYWADVMHVDGFRFDEATTLGRMGPSFVFDRNAPFFQAVHQDPLLSQLKLIAEPWDTGEGGQQLGAFPVLWSEWNVSYRDTVRSFWKGDENQAGSLGHRTTGSADIFQSGGRRPHASINFVTCHDGFTLHDLVTYEHKHNEANREDGRDGLDENHSCNYGTEGETENQGINDLRDRTKRNILTTLFLSRGVPMLTAGDEMGRTQGGNNNAYCHDNEVSWVDWNLDERRRALLDFVKRLSRLRHDEGVVREDHFLRGDHIWDSRLKDLAFFHPDGTEIVADDWPQAAHVRSFAYLLGGEALVVPDKAGRRPLGSTLLMLLNAHHEAIDFTLPDVTSGLDWEIVVDTSLATPPGTSKLRHDAQVRVAERSMMVLRHPASQPDKE
jgi:isoamylase